MSYSYENPNSRWQSPQPRDTIDNLLIAAKQEGHATKEIKVWETDTISVPDGGVGVAATDELNGCHVSIFVTPSENGDAMTITHFPPDLGRERYGQILESLSVSMQAKGVTPKAIVTLTASDRPAREDTWASETFPSTPVYPLSYKARDRERRARPDAGKCMAILDKREGVSHLHILTDSGDQTIGL